MASIYARGKRLYARLKGADGKWIGKPTQHVVGEEAKAQRYADAAQAAIDGKRGGGKGGPLTVELYAERWLQQRREKYEATKKRYEATGTGKIQHRAHVDDAGAVRRHILPYLGAMPIMSVHSHHLADWIHKLRTTTALMPHTIRNIYGLATALFRDAAIAGAIEATPCILTANELGEDEETEGAGRYTREQFELMIGSTQLSERDRLFAAFGGLAGLRLGSIAGLRWGDLDTTAAPLWRLTSARTYTNRPTKTGKPSAIPVHPVLAEMLTSWRHGWGRKFGRAPTADDPIVPRESCIAYTKKTGGMLMDRILRTLAIPSAPMKSHALRSTFISIALEDGADDRLIERITHTAGKTRRAFDRYDRADYWPQLCAEVAKIRIAPRTGGHVVGFATGGVTGGGKMSDDASLEKAAPGPVQGAMGDSGHISPLSKRKGRATGVSRSPVGTDAVARLLQAIAEAASTGDVDQVLSLASDLRGEAGRAVAGGER